MFWGIRRWRLAAPAALVVGSVSVSHISFLRLFCSTMDGVRLWLLRSTHESETDAMGDVSLIPSKAELI